MWDTESVSQLTLRMPGATKLVASDIRRVNVTHNLCHTYICTLFLEESLLGLPLPFLTMYDEGKLICATLFIRHGGTYFVS